MTEQTAKTINSKLMKFQEAWIIIKRNATADILTKNWSKFSYKYSSLDEIWKNISSKLNELKILVSHSIQDYADNLVLETTITDLDSWETKSSILPINKDLNPQTLWSAITYFKRYNLSALLNLIIEGEDDDGAIATRSTQKIEQKKKPDFLEANFEKFKEWAKDKTAGDIINKKEEIVAKYTISEEMFGKLNDFLSSL